MMHDQAQIRADNASEMGEGEKPEPRHFIDVDGAEERHRALPLLIATRRCYMCQQEDEEEPTASSDPKVYIERIVEHCTLTSDYLLPDTPLKEAIFRVMLSGGNRPVTAEEISEILSQKWAMTPFPRDISPRVIGRLLAHSESYCITRAPEPEASPEEEEPTGDSPSE